MNCSCQTAALRIFVRSVVRVHTPSFTPLRGTRSCQTLSRPVPRGHRNDDVAALRRLHLSDPPRRHLSSSAIPLEEKKEQANSGEDPTSIAPAEANVEDVAVPTSHEKALKAKKKRQKLEALQNPDPKKSAKPVKSSKRENLDADKTKDRKQGARIPRKSDDGKQPAGHTRKSDDGKQGARFARKSDEGKQAARYSKTPDDGNQAPPPKKEDWQTQKAALKEKFPEGWVPRKRLSPDALAGIRALHQQFPEEYTTEVLASKFEVSPEAIRRILKSKWEPKPEEEIDRQERWFSRGKRIWSAWAEEGKKPPKKWRKEGITRDPSYHEQRRARSEAQKRLAKSLV